MSDHALDSVLVADRGEPAIALVQSLQMLGIRAISVHTAADSHDEHVRLADESVLLADDGYSDVLQVIEAARQARAHAVHPGTGPLAGRVDVLEAVRAAGLAWLDALGDEDVPLIHALAAETGRTFDG